MNTPTLLSALAKLGLGWPRNFAKATVYLTGFIGLSASAEVISFGSQVARALAGQAEIGLRVTATDDGARLHCAFQKIAAEATPTGLWLTSLSGAVPDRFQIRAARAGRGGEFQKLPEKGSVIMADQKAVWARAGLIEEYSVNMDGVRQDFLLTTRPAGGGALQVELTAQGCRVSGRREGVLLTLAESGRQIAY